MVDPVRSMASSAQVEVREVRDKLEAILRGIPDGVTVQDATGRLVYANDAAARLTGYPSARALLAAPPGETLSRFELLDERGAPFPPECLPGRLALRGERPPETILGFRLRGTQELRWALLTATPVPNESGQVEFAVSVFRDIGEFKRREDAQRFLAEAGEVLNSSLDYETTLASIVRLAVPRIADWCAVDLLGEDGKIRRLTVAHVDPRKVQMACRLEERYPADPNAARGVPNVLRTGRSEYYPDITESLIASSARDEEHLRVLRELGMRSAVIVPLTAGGRTLGAITLVAAESGQRYSPEDLALAEDIGRRAGVSVENARLYGESRRARDALARSEERYRTLAAATAQLVWTADPSGRITSDIAAWSAYTGLSQAEIRDEGWAGAIHPEDRDRTRRVWARADECREQYEAGYRIRRADGVYRTFVERGVPILEPDGSVREWVGTCTDETERRRAEDALRLSETRYRTMIEQSPLSMQVITPDGRTLRVNHAWETLWGVTLDRIGDYNVLHDPQLAEKGVTPYIERALAGEAVSIPPIRYVPDETIAGVSDVGQRWVQAFVYPVKESDGTIREVVLAHQDVTERVRAERRLAAQYAVSRALSESASLEEVAPRILEAIGEALDWDYAALWIVDRRAGALRCADTWHSARAVFPEFEEASRGLTFAPGTGLPGRVWSGGEAVWIADVAEDSSLARSAVAAREGLHGGAAFPIPMGRDVLGVLEFFSHLVRLSDRDTRETMAGLGGQIGQFLERQRAEEAVRESEARKAAVMESALDAIITMGHDGRIVEFNAAAEKAFGYAREDVVGREMAEVIIPPRFRDAHRRGLARYLATGEGRVIGTRVELTAVRSDGEEFPVELAITRVAWEGPPTFTGYIRDITDRTRAESEREELLARVEEALRLRDRFISLSAHELKSPLTALGGHAQLLQREARRAGDAVALGRLEVVNRQVRRMTRLVEQLLDVSRLETGRVEFESVPFDLSAAIREAVEEARVSYPDVALRLEDQAGPARVLGDPDRILRVVANLLANAVKYSGERREIEVRVGREGDWAVVAVSDYGIGIPSEELGRVFDLYFRASNASDRSYDGLGLGLYIGREIVERHGGELRVASREGEGSTFSFTLPMYAGGAGDTGA